MLRHFFTRTRCTGEAPQTGRFLADSVTLRCRTPFYPGRYLYVRLPALAGRGSTPRFCDVPFTLAVSVQPLPLRITPLGSGTHGQKERLADTGSWRQPLSAPVRGERNYSTLQLYAQDFDGKEVRGVEIIRRIIGFFLLSIVPALYIVKFCLEYGPLVTLVALIIAIFVTGLIILGLHLFADD